MANGRLFVVVVVVGTLFKFECKLFEESDGGAFIRDCNVFVLAVLGAVKFSVLVEFKWGACGSLRFKTGEVACPPG